MPNSHSGTAAGSWELPEELRMIQETISRFMRAEVKPV